MTSVAGAMAALSAKGKSPSWAGQQGNVKNIFNEFAEQDPELDTDWDNLDEATLCAQPVYERFAHFLLFVYLIPAGAKNAGLPLEGDIPKNYLNIVINLAASKFKATGTDTTKRFFDCLDSKSTSDVAVWLRGLRANMKREIFERANETGAQMDRSEGELSQPAHLLAPDPALHALPLSLRAPLLAAVPLYYLGRAHQALYLIICAPGLCGTSGPAIG